LKAWKFPKSLGDSVPVHAQELLRVSRCLAAVPKAGWGRRRGPASPRPWPVVTPRQAPRGTPRRNLEPLPTSLSTVMVPPWAVTMTLQFERPSPIPRPTTLFVKKGSKIRSRRAGSMPVPSSTTPRRAIPGAPGMIRMTMRPFSPTVYWTAIALAVHPVLDGHPTLGSGTCCRRSRS
jgi:hypothetical protein